METFLIVVYIIGLVWAILNIILFFKIWGMTNDLKEIKNKYLYDRMPNKQTVKEPETFTVDGKTFKEGDVVIESATGREIIIKSILPNGKIVCWRDKNKTSMEKYSSKEIETIEEYTAHNN